VSKSDEGESEGVERGKCKFGVRMSLANPRYAVGLGFTAESQCIG
jgi:hypothetical protein